MLNIWLSSCKNINEKKMPSLIETYSKNDKNPFGCFIAYKQIQSLYPSNNVKVIKEDFENAWSNNTLQSALYVCITPNLFLTKNEAIAMLDYVSAGNDLFIASNNIDDNLLSRIDCKLLENDNYSFYLEPNLLKNSSTSLNYIQFDSTKFSYYYYPFQSHFFKFNKSTTKAIGNNSNGKTNAIVHFRGKGKLFLFSNPRAFSNYFLLNKNNFSFVNNALAYTQQTPTKVFWDDHYYKLKSRKGEDDENIFSSLSEILKYPSLRIAFWLTLLLITLYIVFNGKRKQRIIPIVKPNENTTLTFTETIGQLYLQHKDNKNIADKMITYFHEFIRNKYFLNTQNINNDFIHTLSKKTNISIDKIDILFNTIKSITTASVVDDYQLLSLNKQIENFYKNKA